MIRTVLHCHARSSALALSVERARHERESELLGGENRLRGGSRAVETDLEPDSAHAGKITVTQNARRMRAELDAAHEGAVGAALVDQDVFAAPLPNGGVPVAHAGIGEPHLRAFAATDDDHRGIEGDGKALLRGLSLGRGPRAYKHRNGHWLNEVAQATARVVVASFGGETLPKLGQHCLSPVRENPFDPGWRNR